MTATERTTITIGGRHFTDAQFAALIGGEDFTTWELRIRAKALAEALGLGSAITVVRPDEMTADEIGENVQANHVEHMTMCTACTWFYCDHYSCDCHESCVGKHDPAGNPL